MFNKGRKRTQDSLLHKVFSTFMCVVLMCGCAVPSSAFANDTNSGSSVSSGQNSITRAPGMGSCLKG